MEVVLSVFYSATGNYGFAIFLLSFLVNLTLLPLFHIAEKGLEAERRVQKRLKPKLQEFRQAFSGEERHMMIRTLYRQAGYHLVFALRSSFGLLIQLPFLTAAYLFLSHYSMVQGASFLIFEDLGKPDALLWGFNLLPFVMTFVTLLSGFVYTRKLLGMERIQIGVLSLFFLVLLYNSPAALVLYWTFNNVFSLVRNIAYGRFNPTQTIESIKEKSTISTFQHLLTHLAQSLSKLIQIINIPAWVKVALFVFFLERMYRYQSLDSSPWNASLAVKEALVILLYLTITSLHGFILSFRPILQNYIQAVLLAMCCIAYAAVAIDWIWGFHVLIERVYINEALAVVMLWTLFISGVRLETTLKPMQHVALLISAVALASVFLFFNPLYVYTSSPEHIGYLTSGDIYFFLYSTLFVAFTLYSISFVFCGYFKGLLSALFMTGITWLTLIAFIYGYLVTVNYGLFRGDKFSDETLLFTLAHKALIPEFLILALVFGVLYKTLELKPVVVPIFFCIIMFFLSKDLIVLTYDENAFPIYSSTGPASFVPINSPAVKAGTNYTPQLSSNGNIRELGQFRFSKTGTNIVLLTPDGGAGYVFSELFKEYPSLSLDLDGFTFYPKTVSVGAFSLASTAALVGGPRYTPYNINQNPAATLEKNMIFAYQWLANQLHAKQYNTTFINPSYVGCAPFKLQPMVQCVSMGRPKNKRALYEMYGLQGDPYLREKALYVFSLFKSLPLTLKPLLYQSQYWAYAFSISGADFEKETTRAYLSHLYFKSLPQLSQVEQSGSSQFIHIWANDLITPFTLDDGCTLAHSGWFDPLGDKERAIATFCHLKSFIQWLKWMKKEEVYDNTKIIVVSDHGAAQYGRTWYRGAVNPILMIKNFGERGALKISERLLSNADTSSFICSAIGGCQGIGPDPTQHSPAGRKVRFSITAHGNVEYARNNNRFEITKDYEFTEKDIRNPDWRKLVQE